MNILELLSILFMLCSIVAFLVVIWLVGYSDLKAEKKELSKFRHDLLEAIRGINKNE